MHECPECGDACYCSGDIDDCPAYTEEWAYINCVHPRTSDCESFYDYEEWDEDWPDDT